MEGEKQMSNEKKAVNGYKKDNQARDWCFTVNNPRLTEEQFCEYLKTLVNVKYFCFGREKGDGRDTSVSGGGSSEGIEHHQGYIEFSMPKKFSTVKGYFSEAAIGVNANVSARIAKRSEARDYVFKRGKHADKAHTRIGGVYEGGEFVNGGERSDFNDIISLIESGASLKEIKEAYPAQYFRYYKNIEHLFHEHMADKFCEVDRNVKVVYVWGPPRIGKSRSLDKLYSRREYYRVQKYKNPFDKYNYQPVLVLDEYDSQIDITYLNNLLDSLPCQLECRYDDKWAAWDTVYIISNLPFEKQYHCEKPEKRAALKSRITEFKYFPGDPRKKTYAELVPLDDDGNLPF